MPASRESIPNADIPAYCGFHGCQQPVPRV